MTVTLRLLIVLALLAPSGAAQDEPLLRFDVRRRMTPLAPQASDTRIVDMNGDGRSDLLIRGPGAIQIYAGDGSGVFDELLSSISVSDFVDGRFELFDAEGDGDLDVVIARRGLCFVTCFDAQARMFLNDGTGHFTNATGQLPSTPNDPHESVAAGDVDGDGDLDLVLSGASLLWTDSNGELQTLVMPTAVWLNDGTGHFSEIPCGIPALEWNQVVLMDLNGDQAAEFLAAPEGGSVDYYTNDGAGGFFANASGLVGAPPSHGALRRIDSVDLDADGDMDLVASFQDEAPVMFLNDGAGLLTALPARLGETRGGSHLVGDFDGDGDADVAVLGATEATTHLNDGAGNFGPPIPLEGYQATQMHSVGDVDGDGDTDAFLEQELFLSDGAGRLVCVTDGLAWSSGAQRVVHAFDYDGDGDLDVALGNQDGGANELLANDGAGRFEPVVSDVFGVSGSVSDLASGDLDGDGWPELAASHRFDDPARVWLSSEAGLVGSVTLPASHGSQAITLGDVDGDGDLDLVTAMEQGLDLVFVNEGFPNVSILPGAVPYSPETPKDLLLADLDGDGDLDLCDGWRRLENNGGPFALASSPYPLVLDTTWDVAAADVDGDGDLDLMLGTEEHSGVTENRLFLNDGLGAFTDASPQLEARWQSTRRVTLEDYDLDGDVDAIWSNRVGTTLLLNAGGSTFVEVMDHELDDLWTDDAAAGDFDGDGDVDVFNASATGNDVLFDLRTQINATAIPRAGKELTIELRDPVAGGWSLAWSTGRAVTRLEDAGTLWLEPSKVNVVGTGLFDANGKARFTTLVPPDTSLLGATVYAQAGIGLPLRLTNLETLPITGL